MPSKPRTPRSTLRLPKAGDRIRPWLRVRKLVDHGGEPVMVLEIPGYVGEIVSVPAAWFLERTGDEAED